MKEIAISVLLSAILFKDEIKSALKKKQEQDEELSKTDNPYDLGYVSDGRLQRPGTRPYEIIQNNVILEGVKSGESIVLDKEFGEQILNNSAQVTTLIGSNWSLANDDRWDGPWNKSRSPIVYALKYIDVHSVEKTITYRVVMNSSNRPYVAAFDELHNEIWSFVKAKRVITEIYDNTPDDTLVGVIGDDTTEQPFIQVTAKDIKDIANSTKSPDANRRVELTFKSYFFWGIRDTTGDGVKYSVLDQIGGYWHKNLQAEIVRYRKGDLYVFKKFDVQMFFEREPSSIIKLQLDTATGTYELVKVSDSDLINENNIFRTMTGHVVKTLSVTSAGVDAEAVSMSVPGLYMVPLKNTIIDEDVDDVEVTDAPASIGDPDNPELGV